MQRKCLIDLNGLLCLQFCKNMVLGFFFFGKMLFSKSMASIKTNNFLSKPFIQNQETKQVCPSSGLIFNLFTEPLAEKIRSDNNIRGLEIGNV